MSAALVSAIRDFSGICKALQSANAKPSSEIQLQMLELEKHINEQLGPYKVSPLINISATARVSGKHHPLIHSNSIAVPTVNNSNHISHREHRKLDRCVSEPVERTLSVNQQQRQIQPNSSRYKTELCRPFEESGTCKYGDKCQFAHGFNELRTLSRHPKYKTELCRTFHTTGFCPYGPRCHFIHNDAGKAFAGNNSSPTGSVNIPTSVPHVGSTTSNGHSVDDFEIGSYSIGSAGELSPKTSSSSGGSPPSTNGFFAMDDTPPAFSPPVPHTAPPYVNNTRFFGQDFTPFTITNGSNTLPPSPPARELLHRRNFVCEQNDINNSAVNLLSASLDNLNIREHSILDINRNLRLPIFNQFAYGGQA